MSGKFSILEFLIKEANADEDNVEDPNLAASQAQQAPQGVAPEGNPQDVQQPGQEQLPPGQQTQKLKELTSPFEDALGGVVKNMSFKQNGPEGGQLSVMLAKSGRPFVISWVNGRVTLTKPNGDVVALT